jgi:hypothetical protein
VGVALIALCVVRRRCCDALLARVFLCMPACVCVLSVRVGWGCLPMTRLERQAYFYSLVSCDTQEIGNLQNRRDYLINQGFNFQVLTAQRVSGGPRPARRGSAGSRRLDCEACFVCDVLLGMLLDVMIPELSRWVGWLAEPHSVWSRVRSFACVKVATLRVAQAPHSVATRVPVRHPHRRQLLTSTQLPQEHGRPENHPSLVKQGLLVGSYRPSAYVTKESQQELLQQAMMAKDVYEERLVRSGGCCVCWCCCPQISSLFLPCPKKARAADDAEDGCVSLRVFRFGSRVAVGVATCVRARAVCGIIMRTTDDATERLVRVLSMFGTIGWYALQQQ